MAQRSISTVETIALVLHPDNGRKYDVMAANYDFEGEEGEWDGLYPDDVATFTQADGTIDLDSFGLWGPFEVWMQGEDDE